MGLTVGEVGISLLPKMATVIDLQELEAFFHSLKEECCESVLEISMKCVEALKGNSFVEAIAFNQVRDRKPPNLAFTGQLDRTFSTFLHATKLLAPGMLQRPKFIESNPHCCSSSKIYWV